MSATQNQKFYAALVGAFMGIMISFGTLYSSIAALSLFGIGYHQYASRWVEYVTAGLFFFAMASIPLIIHSRGWSLESASSNTKREVAAKAFFRHLSKIGLSTTLVKYYPSNSYWGSIGTARIAGHSINLIELDWREEVKNIGGGIDPETGGQTPDLHVYKSKYRCNYLVHVPVKGSEEKLEAKGIVLKKNGIIRRGMVDFEWEGKELAQKLNNDFELKSLFLSQRLLPTLTIEPNRRGYPYVRISHASWHHRPRSAFPSFADFEVYDRIAKHIHKHLAQQRGEECCSRIFKWITGESDREKKQAS